MWSMQTNSLELDWHRLLFVRYGFNLACWAKNNANSKPSLLEKKKKKERDKGRIFHSHQDSFICFRSTPTKLRFKHGPTGRTELAATARHTRTPLHAHLHHHQHLSRISNRRLLREKLPRLARLLLHLHPHAVQRNLNHPSVRSIIQIGPLNRTLHSNHRHHTATKNAHFIFYKSCFLTK